jgi:hypothetical protein
LTRFCILSQLIQSTGTTSLIENGIQGMKTAVVIKAAEFFRVPASVLFSPTYLEKDELQICSAAMNLRKTPV